MKKPTQPEHGFERLGDDAIETQHRRMMNSLAHTLDDVFNGEKKGKDRTVGFILMVFNFGTEGRTNYISNADRASVVEMLKEQIKRFEEPEAQGHA